MTQEIDPVRLTRAFHDAIDVLDFDAIDGFFADGACFRSVKVGALEGRAEIMAAFRRYFEEYPDQCARDIRIEGLSACSSRSVWHVTATSTITGLALDRRGEEVVIFDDRGKIIGVDVTDYT